MKKQIRKSAAGALLLLMTTLGACGEDRQEAENMTGKDQATEMTGSMSEEDRSMFAGGMATEDPQEPDVTVTPTAAPTAEAVSDDAVEEQCPAAIANARTDIMNTVRCRSQNRKDIRMFITFLRSCFCRSEFTIRSANFSG